MAINPEAVAATKVPFQSTHSRHIVKQGSFLYLFSYYTHKRTSIITIGAYFAATFSTIVARILIMVFLLLIVSGIHAERSGNVYRENANNYFTAHFISVNRVVESAISWRNFA